MHGKILFICLIVPLIEGHDVAVGLNNYGKKIFEEERQASPAIWRQQENVTIEAAVNEVITKVIIIDMRPEKDGEASIIDGGEGKKNVTIELKSPTVLRGYDFYIEVFSAPDIQNDNETTQNSSPMPPDCNNPTSTNSAESTRPIRTTNEEKGMNNEGSTLHTSIVNSTSPASLANTDETTSVINNISTTSINNLPDTKNSNLDVPALTGMESNETNYVENTTDVLIMTTSDNLETTTIEYATLKNENTNGKDIPDFPDMIGFNDDETRHAREAKDFETTSIASDSTTEVTTEITTVDPDSNVNNESTQNIPLLNMEAYDARFPRESEKQTPTTEDGITEKTTDLITMLNPESEDTKTLQDFADISGIGAEETTLNTIYDTSTEGDITEITTELTTVVPDDINQNISVSEDTRRAREAKEATTTVSDSSTTTETLTSTITEDYSGDGSDDFDLSYLNNKGEAGDNITTEESGLHVDLTPPANTDNLNNPLYNFGDGDSANNPTLTSQDSFATPPIVGQPDANVAKEQVLRNSRNTAQLFGNMMNPNMMVNSPNYPLFVSPSFPSDNEQPNSESDYVYVPLIAIVSNSSYSSFESALQSLMQQSKIAFQTQN